MAIKGNEAYEFRAINIVDDIVTIITDKEMTTEGTSRAAVNFPIRCTVRVIEHLAMQCPARVSIKCAQLRVHRDSSSMFCLMG